MFVTPQDFIDLPYNLPQMNAADTQAVFQKFINRNEAVELRQVLGGDFYEAFAAYMNALPALWQPGPVSYDIGAIVLYGYDIYTCLQNGVVNVQPGTDGTKWQVSDRDRWQKLWAGESYADQNGYKENWAGMVELIKPMIYAFWLRDEINTGVQSSGVIQQQSENATNITATFRMSDALATYSLKAGKYSGYERDTLYNYLFTKAVDFADIGAAIPVVNGDFVNYLRYFFANPGFVNDFDI